MRYQKVQFSIITRQLLFTLVTAAFIIILIMVSVEVRLEYKQKLGELNGRLDRIPVAFLDIITHSLWVFDDKQLENSVHSIYNIGGVSYISITSAEDNVISAGRIGSGDFKSLSYDLDYQYDGKIVRLGVLDVQYQLPQIGEILVEHLIKIFLRAGLVVSLIFIILFILVNYFIARPISDLAMIIQDKSDYSTAIFPRKRIFKTHDEIDFLVSAFNRTFKKIRQEIHEREENEKELINTVKEKNVLISEVHHRVKNNLQIILSLLNLQKNESDSIEDALNATINRIRAMSEVHEQLYNSDDFSQISMNSYLDSLVKNMSEFSVDTSIIMVSGDNDLIVPLDTAIPLGLIINELISNSLKYAFPVGGGRIFVEIIEKQGEYSGIRVKDNGIGINSIDDLQKSSSLGFHIVKSLVGQIDGEISIVAENGLSITVSVPV